MTYILNGCEFKHSELIDNTYEYKNVVLTESQLITLGATPQEEDQKEIKPSNIDFKSKTDWQAHFIQLEQKLNEAITHITKLERRERE